MTFTGRLKKLKEKIPSLTDEELVATHNDLSKASVVLYMGAPDRVLNLCNEVLDLLVSEQERRAKSKKEKSS